MFAISSDHNRICVNSPDRLRRVLRANAVLTRREATRMFDDILAIGIGETFTLPYGFAVERLGW